MPDTTPKAACVLAILAAANFFFCSAAAAEDKTPPASAADLEAIYTVAIENRAVDIVKELKLSDSAKAARVRDALLAQYRALKARDEAIDAKLKSKSKEAAVEERATLVRSESKPLHDQFLAKLSAELTPEQVETVKDKMTYKKVKVTYDAYCAIVPDLTVADKAKILDVLKEAREEAMDGGSATEKSAIFQKYKDRINAFLNASGHDVAKAYKDWEAKQDVARKANDPSAPQARPQ